jgi:YbbR domain-containing protein
VTRLLRNWRLKVVAALFAATTWGVVAYAGNPVVVRDVARIPVTATTPPNNWVMVSQLPPVTVTVSGLKQNVDAFQASNLHVFADLQSAKLGPNLVKVRVDMTDSRVAVTQVLPDSVEVLLDEKDVVTKKVVIDPKNAPNNCCVAQNLKAAANPDTVRLTGPKSVVAKAVPTVSIDLTEARTDVTRDVDVRVDGVDPRAAPLLTVEPKRVQVTVPVTLVKKTVSVGVRVVKIGDPAAGYEVSAVRVTPDILTAEGDPPLVANLTTIETEPVNVSGATTDVVRTVGLRPPPGVTVAASTVTVRISIVQTAPPPPPPSPSPSPARP